MILFDPSQYVICGIALKYKEFGLIVLFCHLIGYDSECVISCLLAGIFIINVGKTWEKLELAARVIVAIENPQDIIVQSARPYGQRAVLKFAQHTGAQAIAGRHTPGTFTNQLQTTFCEPRLLILTDPRTDHQVRGN